MLSIDTETTGVDFWHGCRPFFVSLCWATAGQFYTDFYEWDVDPLTRLPYIPQENLKALQQRIVDHCTRVLHNTKFDKRGLATLGINLPWQGTEDTLVASHVLCSNESHGLKDLTLLHCDIPDDDERELQEATNEARRFARKLGWRVAQPNDPHWPAIKSVKDGWWKFDTWLPRAVAKHLYSCGDHAFAPDEHPWWTVLRRYALQDAERTLALWLIQEPALREAGLWEIYEHRRSLLETTWDMEQTGVTISGPRTAELKATFEQRRVNAMQRLTEIVSKLPYGQQLAHPPPRTVRGKLVPAKPLTFNPGSTKQLRVIMFDKKLGLGLRIVKWTKPKEAEPGPSTDKDVVKELLDEVEPQTTAQAFLTNLVRVRKATKHVEYLAEYEASGIPIPQAQPQTAQGQTFGSRPSARPVGVPGPSPQLQHHGQRHPAVVKYKPKPAKRQQARGVEPAASVRPTPRSGMVQRRLFKH